MCVCVCVCVLVCAHFFPLTEMEVAGAGKVTKVSGESTTAAPTQMSPVSPRPGQVLYDTSLTEINFNL